MNHLPLPTANVRDLFLTAISNYDDPDLKSRLADIVDQLVAASADYVEAQGNLSRCCILGGAVDLRSVTKQELINVYDRKVARAKQPGRPFYDRIRNAPARGRCPLCGKSQVSQLDHNLQKARYPILAVTPANLVPSCADCNKRKESAPHETSEHTLHPYFHRLDDVRWLHAYVVPHTPPVIEYGVVPAHNWTAELTSRANNHLDVFGLRAAYSIEAAQEITEIRRRLLRMVDDTGVSGIREHLLSEAESREAANRNSWRTALYYALAHSDWFCTEGVRLLASS